MHDDEAPSDPTLVRGLLGAQFPQWADLPIRLVRAASSDNAMYRLGADLAARLPRRPSALRPMEKEHAWLPRLAPRLPLPVPAPLARGEPGEGYPFAWSVCRWIQGANPSAARLAHPGYFADDLAAFIRALQAIDTAGAPGPGSHNHFRGAPLAQWGEVIAQRLGWLADLPQIERITAAWRADAGAPPWDGPPVWIHGDLSAGNLVQRAGRLSGVIDWSCLGAGDPACELQVAWSLFDPDTRERFRVAMAVDDATWTRGRAWGLAMGVLNLSYYRARSPVLARNGRRAIAAVLADQAR